MKITVVVLKTSQKSDNYKSISAFILHFDSFFLTPAPPILISHAKTKYTPASRYQNQHVLS